MLLRGSWRGAGDMQTPLVLPLDSQRHRGLGLYRGETMASAFATSRLAGSSASLPRRNALDAGRRASVSIVPHRGVLLRRRLQVPYSRTCQRGAG